MYKYEDWQYRKRGNTRMVVYDKCNCGRIKYIKSKRCMHCFKTGHKQYEDWQFVTYSNGKRIREYNKCPNCGNKKTREAKLCIKCHVDSINLPKRMNSKGYIRYKIGNKKWKLEHAMVVEKAIGRPLRRHEKIHHINMIKQDNRNCNLLVCDMKYHSWLHQQYARRFAELHLQ